MIQTLQLELTVEDVNAVLTSLGQQPYQSVYELINKIREQSEEQLQNQDTETAIGMDDGEVQ